MLNMAPSQGLGSQVINQYVFSPPPNVTRNPVIVFFFLCELSLVTCKPSSVGVGVFVYELDRSDGFSAKWVEPRSKGIPTISQINSGLVNPIVSRSN